MTKRYEIRFTTDTRNPSDSEGKWRTQYTSPTKAEAKKIFLSDMKKAKIKVIDYQMTEAK